MNQQQLQTARAALWHQNASPLVTGDDAAPWLDEIGFCLFLPRHAQLPAPAPSFVEACMGQASMTPPGAAIATATALATRLVDARKAIPLNLLGAFSEQPDFLVTPEVLPWVAAIHGERSWKAAPSGRTSPIVLRTWEALEKRGGQTAVELREVLGREVTEAAVLRALVELWNTLRVVPTYTSGEPTRWNLLKDWYSSQLATGANTSQATALSAMLSIYVRSAVAATAEEAEVFLSPLTARSRIREVLHGMIASRSFGSTTVGTDRLLFVEGSLPEAAEETPSEEPAAEAQPGERNQERKPPTRERREPRRFGEKAQGFGQRPGQERPRRESRAPSGEQRPRSEERPRFGARPGEKRPWQPRQEGRTERGPGRPFGAKGGSREERPRPAGEGRGEFRRPGTAGKPFRRPEGGAERGGPPKPWQKRGEGKTFGRGPQDRPARAPGPTSGPTSGEGRPEREDRPRGEFRPKQGERPAFRRDRAAGSPGRASGRDSGRDRPGGERRPWQNRPQSGGRPRPQGGTGLRREDRPAFRREDREGSAEVGPRQTGAPRPPRGEGSFAPRPGGRPGGKPGTRPGGRTGARTGGRPAGRPGGKPGFSRSRPGAEGRPSRPQWKQRTDRGEGRRSAPEPGSGRDSTGGSKPDSERAPRGTAGPAFRGPRPASGPGAGRTPRRGAAGRPFGAPGGNRSGRSAPGRPAGKPFGKAFGKPRPGGSGPKRGPGTKPNFRPKGGPKPGRNAGPGSGRSSGKPRKQEENPE